MRGNFRWKATASNSTSSHLCLTFRSNVLKSFSVNPLVSVSTVISLFLDSSISDNIQLWKTGIYLLFLLPYVYRCLLFCWFLKFPYCSLGDGGLVAKLCLTLTIPQTVVRQAPLSVEFSWQEYWGGLPFPSPGKLPDPAIKPRSPALQADSLPLSYKGSL